MLPPHRANPLSNVPPSGGAKPPPTGPSSASISRVCPRSPIPAEMNGPWHLLGMQGVLQWSPHPLEILVFGGAGLVILWLRPRLPSVCGPRLKLAYAVATVIYVVFCSLGFPQRSGSTDRPVGGGDANPGVSMPVSAGFPVVLGRSEGCLVCHGDVAGLGSAHSPASIGCASCHGGDISTADAQRAHATMFRVPGNLAVAARTCGAAGCHADVIPRVERSIMSTFSGVIDVNRHVFGEARKPGAPPPHVRDLGQSAADSHLRQLCVSCHLGQEKTDWGPITEGSRGGGCNACHLLYHPVAIEQLSLYQRSTPGSRPPPTEHPSFTLNPENNHCFGCHSRSSRISTNYEGWHELREPPSPAGLKPASEPARFRQLEDGRVFTRIREDVHHTRGLDCIDCHTATEVMGGDTTARHKSEQVKIRCEDCHASHLASVPVSGLDAESFKLIGLRQWPLPPEQRFGTTRGGGPLVNVYIAPDGTGLLRRKRTGQTAPLSAPTAACSAGPGHDRLSCASCHTPWAPRCASCHTSFDSSAEGFDLLLQQPVKGSWTETSGPFEAAPPTLGIRIAPSDPAHPEGTVDTFVPGMIMSLDRNQSPDGKPDSVFRRLYARTSAHTVSREARSCQSCHSDPVALGYGRGELRYETSGAGGRWHFTPSHSVSPEDGLPSDAWIGFLQTRTDQVSAHDDVRPFNTAEQQRILRVGACLTCHPGGSATMRQAVVDFDSVLARRKPSCSVPVWSE